MLRFGADIEREGMHIVDVGWKGTIQDNLYYLYEEHVEMEGLYIGMVAPGTIAEKIKKVDYYFLAYRVFQDIFLFTLKIHQYLKCY